MSINKKERIKMEEDKKLYKEYLNGNKEALNKLIYKYKNNLIYFITRYVKNIEVAEDIFQDIVLYFLEHKEKYNSKYSFKTYLYIIAKSRALNYINKNNTKTSIDEYQNELVEEELIENVIFSKERQEKIRNVINKMKKDYQLVIYLTKIEGLSYKETAKIMDKSEKQIKTLAFNAKNKLRNLLIKEKVIEVKNNKIIKLIIWILLVTLITSSVVYAGYKVYKIYQATITPTYTRKIRRNKYK